MGGVIVGLLVATVPAVAHAEPAVLYVPNEDVQLRPTGVGECRFGGATHSGVGCAHVDAETAVPAYADAVPLAAELSAALDTYDVHVTNVRPPVYLPYVMLLPSDEAADENPGHTCTSGSIYCGARRRNDILFTYGSTENCLVSEPIHAALHAFGRVSGLEGVDNAGDVMGYVPNYGSPVSFLDACSDRVNQLGTNDEGEVIPLPLECTSIDHVGCADGQQNSHAELLERYGPRVVDVDPPVIESLSPEEGVIVYDDELVLEVVLSDADPVLGGRWTLSSPAIMSSQFPEGMLSYCTNEACDFGWDDGQGSKPTDSDWSLVLQGLPAGEYELTFEVSDFHGNVADIVVRTFEVSNDAPPPGKGEDEDSGDGDGGDTTGGPGPSSTTGPADETGVPPGDDGATTEPLPPVGEGTDSGGDGGAADEDGVVDRGCSCRSNSPQGGMPWLLGFTVMALIRRRRAAR